MDRGAWQATVHGVTELDMTEHLHELESNTAVGARAAKTWPEELREDGDYVAKGGSGFTFDEI